MTPIDVLTIAGSFVWVLLLCISANVAIHDVKRLKIREEDVMRVLGLGLIMVGVVQLAAGWELAATYLLSHLEQALLYSIPFIVFYKFKKMGEGDAAFCGALFFALPGEAPTFFLIALPFAMIGSYLLCSKGRGKGGRTPLGPAICLAVLAAALALCFPGFPIPQG